MIVGVVAKIHHTSAPELSRRIIAWLEQRGIQYRLGLEIAERLGVAADDPVILVDRDRFTSICDVVVVLGGDGTMISVSRHPSERPSTIIGVNLGTLGFLTEITIDELFSTLEAAVNGNVAREPRYLLSAEVKREGKIISRYTAINDVVITKEALARIFSIALWVDDQFAATVRGDGVIVATPVGSTAYSMAAGGSIVHPAVSALLVTSICPHSLTSRPLVLPGKSTLRLTVSSATTEDEPEVYLTIDGQEGRGLTSGDEVIITTSDRFVYFAKSSSRSYFQVLATKLKWANH